MYRNILDLLDEVFFENDIINYLIFYYCRTGKLGYDLRFIEFFRRSYIFHVFSMIWVRYDLERDFL